MDIYGIVMCDFTGAISIYPIQLNGKIRGNGVEFYPYLCDTQSYTRSERNRDQMLHAYNRIQYNQFANDTQNIAQQQ